MFPIIPDDLLGAVAAPRYPSRPITFTFHGDDEPEALEVPAEYAPIVSRLSYVSAIADLETDLEEVRVGGNKYDNTGEGKRGRSSSSEEEDQEQALKRRRCDRGEQVERGGGDLSVPISKGTPDDLLDLLFLCRWRLPRRFPTAAYVRRLVELADYLGVPKQMLSSLRAGGATLMFMDVEERFPMYGRAMYAASVAAHQLGSFCHSESPVPDDDALHVLCTHEPSSDPNEHPILKETIERAKRSSASRAEHDGWLFPACRAMRPTVSGLVPGDQLRLPAFAREWLWTYPDLVLAGGAALAAIAPDVEACDYDFFFHGVSPEAAEETIRGICSSGPMVRFIVQSSHAITLGIFLEEEESESSKPSYIAQLITRTHSNPAWILRSFDLHPCKILVRADHARSALVVEATTTWLHAWANNVIVVTPDMMSPSLTFRVLKYSSRRFNVYIPCTARWCMLSPSTLSDWRGIGELFAFQEARRLKEVRTHRRSRGGPRRFGGGAAGLLPWDPQSPAQQRIQTSRGFPSQLEFMHYCRRMSRNDYDNYVRMSINKFWRYIQWAMNQVGVSRRRGGDAMPDLARLRWRRVGGGWSAPEKLSNAAAHWQSFYEVPNWNCAVVQERLGLTDADAPSLAYLS